MRIIALRTIKQFIESRSEYADARDPTLAWYRQVLRADWAAPADVKREIGNASILRDGRVVFNVAGNKYRIVVWINYPYRAGTPIEPYDVLVAAQARRRDALLVTANEREFARVPRLKFEDWAMPE